MTDMTKFSVYTWDDGTGIAKIFKEVSETVLYGLRDLGYEANMGEALVTEGKRTILFNSNSFAARYHPKSLPAPPVFSIGWHLNRRPEMGDCIIYNLEPCESFWLDYLLPIVGDREVWDYSHTNVEWWISKGVNAKYVPIGYVNQLCRIVMKPKDIDVLFYGGAGSQDRQAASRERRMMVMNQCKALGLSVKHLNGTFGEERDEWIARSKIVINVHRQLDKGYLQFESVRCSYPLANGVCVVSEESTGADPYRGAVVFRPYEQIAATCKNLITSGDWKKIGEMGQAHFSSTMPERSMLATVLSDVGDKR